MTYRLAITLQGTDGAPVKAVEGWRVIITLLPTLRTALVVPTQPLEVPLAKDGLATCQLQPGRYRAGIMTPQGEHFTYGEFTMPARDAVLHELLAAEREERRWDNVIGR